MKRWANTHFSADLGLSQTAIFALSSPSVDDETPASWLYGPWRRRARASLYPNPLHNYCHIAGLAGVATVSDGFRLGDGRHQFSRAHGLAYGFGANSFTSSTMNTLKSASCGSPAFSFGKINNFAP